MSVPYAMSAVPDRRLTRDAAAQRWPRVLAVLLVGTVATLILVWALARIEEGSIEADFRKDAHDRISAFEVALRHGLDALVALDALYGSTAEVSRSDFVAFTGEHLLDEPGVLLLGWAPRVPAERREVVEEAARGDSTNDPFIDAALRRFRFFEAGDDGAEVAVGPRSEYFPVLFAEPASIGEHILGFDIASDSLQADALSRARSSGEAAATGRAALGPTSDRGWGTVIFRPVFDELPGPDPQAGSRQQLRGFVFGMFDIAEVVEAALATLEPRGVDIAVFDLDSMRAESLLYFHRSRLSSEGTVWSLDNALASEDLQELDTVRVGDRGWLVSCRPAPGYVSSRTTWTPLVTLVAGLLLTGILATSFYTVLEREAEAERSAADLLEAKERLETEAVDREKTRSELAASEDLLRRVYDGAPVGIGRADPEGRFLAANPALCSMLQVAESELVGLSVSGFTHPDDIDMERRQFRRLLERETEFVRYQERIRRRDGSEIWAELHVSLVRDERDQPLYFVGLIQDVTERREIDERLRRAWATQEKLLDSLPLNVFLKDAQGTIRFINAQGLEFLRRERDEVVGKTDFDLFPEEIARELQEVDRKVLDGGEALVQEEVLEVDGRARYSLSGKTAIEIEGWDGPHVLGFSIDMTRIRDAEEALRRSEHRFRQLVENMSSGVAVYEAVDDGDDFVFTDYNRAAERMGGQSREEILGQRLSVAFPGAEEMGVLDLLRRVWRTGVPERLGARLYRDHRHEGWRENYAYRLPTGEVVAIYDDVGERKRLEDELLHAQKMEAVGRLAGGVAHDFNNLLQVVAGNADLLLDGGDDAEHTRTMLCEIQEQAERGTQLVRRLLAFSRRQGQVVAAIDLGGVLQRSETLIRRLIKENIELRIEAHAEPVVVIGDAGQLEQVLMNLVVNAADAMPAGGTLTIRSGTDDREVAWFSVSDTGSGITSDVLDKIFDPYFTTKSASQGTGLGLAVVDGIVSRHNGRIDVESSAAAGTTFKVSLPLERERELVVPEESPAAAPVRGDGQHVLVVEDQQLVRKTIETMLGALGYVVTTAADGASARQRVSAEQFDLLVSDIVLPDATGVDLALEFREKRPGLAVLLVSGYAEESVRQQAADFRFLQKPFRLEDLARRVEEALSDTVEPRS